MTIQPPHHSANPAALQSAGLQANKSVEPDVANKLAGGELSSRHTSRVDINLSSRSRELSASDGGAAPTAAVDKSSPVVASSAEHSAGVILEFISGHLQRLQADGAGEEELADALYSGLKGFLQGFGEAVDIIQGVGAMTEELAAELGGTKGLVLAGISDLQQQYAPGTDPLDFSDADVELPVSARPPEPLAIHDRQASFYSSYQSSQSSSLQVRTLDGDIIDLQFSRQHSEQQAALYEQGDGETGFRYGALSQSSSDFQLTITGELDEGELQALEDLLTQVRSLSDEFFSGDSNRAFEQALALDMDGSELASMDLSLARSRRTVVAASYEQVQSLGAEPVTAERPLAFGSMLQGALQAQQQAFVFENPTNVLADMLAEQFARREWLTGDRPSEPMVALLQGVLEGVTDSGAED